MTFNIHASSLTTQDAHALLDILKISGDIVGVEEVLRVRPEMTISQAEALLVAANHAGILKVSAPFYTLTDDGFSFLQYGMQKRFDRKRADEVIAKAIAAARRWNKNQDHPVFVRELRLFGSTLEERDSYGDVDIEIHTAVRKISSETMKRQVEALPDSVTKTYIGRAHPEFEVKRRSARAARVAVNRAAKEIALCLQDTISEIGADYMQIYCYDAEHEAEVPAEMVHHPRTHPREIPASSGPVTRSQIVPPLVAPIRPYGHCFWTTDLGELADKHWRGKGTGKEGRRALRLSEIDYDKELVGNIAWLEGCHEWPLQAKDPFKALAELQIIGQELSVLSRGDLVVHVSGTEISVEFPCALGKGLAIMITAEVKGKKVDLNLIPWLVHAGRGSNGDDLLPLSILPEHVSIARSSAQHLAAIHRMLAPAPATEMKLSFALDAQRSGTVTLPRISALMSEMKSRTIELSDKDFGKALSIAKRRTSSHPHRWLDVRETNEIVMTFGDGGLPGIGRRPTEVELCMSSGVNAGCSYQNTKPCKFFHDMGPLFDRAEDFGDELSAVVSAFRLHLWRETEKTVYLRDDDQEDPRALAERVGIVLRETGKSPRAKLMGQAA